MAKFATDNISKPVCSLANLSICSDEDKAVIADLQKKTREELEATETAVTERLEAAQAEYEKAVEELQANYEKMSADFNTDLETIRKETNFKWVQQVLLAEGDSAGGDEL